MRTLSNFASRARAIRRLVGGASAAFLVIAPRAASADTSFAVHGEGAAAHMIGDNKWNQFGWGATGLVGAELRFARAFGVELDAAILGLAKAKNPDPAYVASDNGSAFFLTPGVRVRPFAFGAPNLADGLWLTGGGGVSITGAVARPALDARLGFDLPLKSAAIGPFVGWMQVIETAQSDRPQDGRVVVFGLHGELDTMNRRAQFLDRDHDHISDAIDKCPDEPEDRDGFEDSDGCPDLDNDHDGIPDAIDKCPNVPEDKDGFEDNDGCPDADNDKDGIADAIDKCPNEPEDKDGFEDIDGCPDPDNDHDGIADAVDKCPNERETVNGYADDDGCPDENLVRVLGDKIVLDDRIHFKLDQAEIEKRSFPLMASIAKLILGHPEYELIQVDGHTDDQGTDDYNLRLSANRAKAVKAHLVSLGVDEARLKVEFYGESRPRAEGTSDKARAENRRVEFEIIRRRVVNDARSEEPAANKVSMGGSK